MQVVLLLKLKLLHMRRLHQEWKAHILAPRIYSAHQSRRENLNFSENSAFNRVKNEIVGYRYRERSE
jgi:hypothetical protein